MSVFFGVLALIIAFVVMATLPVYFLWNWLMPIIFGLPEVTFLQAFGLTLLSKLLFSGVGYSKKD